MIDKLDAKQEELISKVRDEWLDISQSQKDVTIQDVEEGVIQLYALDGRPKPLILILDDPLQCQYLANILYNKNQKNIYLQIRSQIDSQIRSQIDSQISSQIDSQISSQIYLQISSQIDSQIDSQIYLQISSQIDSQIDSQIRSQIDSQNLTLFNQLGGLSWCSRYMAVFDYYLKSGLLFLGRRQKQLANSQINFLKKGVWDLIIFENVCIISKTPKTKRDDEGKLHSIKSKAVEFKSGYGFYAIHGVVFEEKLWKQVSQRKLSAKQVLSIQNIEQRFAAIRYYGMDKIFDELDCTLLDKSERGNELYSVCGINPGKPVLYLKYADVSPTGRIFVKGIPDKDDTGLPIETADHAQAWSHNMTLKEYNSLEVES